MKQMTNQTITNGIDENLQNTKKRQTRPSWMNHEQMIEFEDRYIQYCIIDNFNSNAREDIINIKEEQATKKCPFCRKS